MGTTIQFQEKGVTPPSHDHAKDMLLRNTTDVLHAFMECSDDVQQGVLKMVRILGDPNADDDEKAAAADTLIEALYPQYTDDEMGMDLFTYDKLQAEHEPEIEQAMDREEASFADLLSVAMEKKGMSQTDLARITGVNQSAISMMLSRNCRPQKRTVQKLAEGLGMTAAELWRD